MSAGKHVVLADLNRENADAAAEMLRDAGFDVITETVDVSSRESVHTLVETATTSGNVTGVIHAAGVSPSQASPATILAVDLYGTALVLEEFGNVIARGGVGVVIASQSGHRLDALTAEQNAALATTPADELLKLPLLQPDQVTDSLHAYQLAKRGNSLRVMAEAVRWGKRGARINTISPGIIFTPLARDELTGPRGEGYRRMIELCPAGRGGTPDEVGAVGALLMGTTARSPPEATSSWTAESPPPTSTASSPRTETIWVRSLYLQEGTALISTVGLRRRCAGTRRRSSNGGVSAGGVRRCAGLPQPGGACPHSDAASPRRRR